MDRISNIEVIKDRLDIVDVVGEVVQLRKKGRSYSGCCPFHGESNPSFHVYPKTQTYKCFACNVYGSVIDFYAFTRQINFAQAVKELEKELGLASQQTYKFIRTALKNEDYKEVGLHARSMRQLFEEDEETYFFILSEKIKEKLTAYKSMAEVVPQGLVAQVVNKKYDYFYDLWFRGIVEERSNLRIRKEAV